MVQIYQSMQKIWSKYNFLVKMMDFQILSRTGQMEILILSRTQHTKCEISWKRKVHMVKLLVLFNTYIRVTSGRTEHFLYILLILSISLRRVRDKCDFFGRMSILVQIWLKNWISFQIKVSENHDTGISSNLKEKKATIGQNFCQN